MEKRYISLAKKFLTLSPELSRYFMFKNLKINPKFDDKCWCKVCGSYYFPNNLKVRLSPKPALNKHAKSLIKRYVQDRDSLNKCQQSLALHHLEAGNKMVFTCRICNTKSISERLKQKKKKHAVPKTKDINPVEESKSKERQLVLDIMSEIKSENNKSSKKKSHKRKSLESSKKVSPKKSKKQLGRNVKNKMEELLRKDVAQDSTNGDSLLDFLLST
ncbi:uncharacterized protein LOC115212332 [Argonauta hians]